MKKLFSRIILFTLIFAMLLQPMVGAVSAKGNETTEKQSSEYVYHQINPLNGGMRYKTARTLAQATAPTVDLTTYTSYSAAGKYMRQQMVNRTSSINFTLRVSNFNNDLYEVTDLLHEAAFTHTGNPKEGDSLKWQWYSWSLSYDYNYSGGYYYLDLYYTYEYRTTASQEAQVDTAVRNLRNQLGLSGLSDYQKVYKIYQWITANVTYDYYHYYNDPDYRIQYSTYGAIIDRTCVCQGYALLFYRLALEEGIDARLVAGDGGGPHGWNIVQLDGLYYNLDSTWDAGYNPSSWSWFLLSDANFVRHYRDDGSNFDIDYTSAEFYKKYPMGKSNYDPNKVTAPTLKVSNVASTGKIKLTWNKISAAAKYEVYRATSKTGTYTKLSTVTGTSLTNGSAPAGKTYYYKIRAVSANGTKSGWSNIVSRTCDLPRPDVTVSNIASSGKIKVSWKKIDGAIKYEVYRATSENGTYSKLITTTSTSINNTSATAGKTYYYKVKAIHSNSSANSAYSLVDARTCDLAQPTLTVKRNSNGDPKLTWAKVSGAVKYQVYMATSKNGTYKLLKTVTGTSLTHSSAAAGQTLYYKVRAIHSNSAANSAYSEIKYITVK